MTSMTIHSSTHPSTGTTAKVCFLIIVATLLAQLTSLRFGGGLEGQVFSDVVLPSSLVLLVVSVPCTLVGVLLGSRVGLGTPRLIAFLEGRAGVGRDLRSDIVLATQYALLVGLALLALRFIAQPLLPAEIPALGHRGVVGGLAVSLGAAIGEEVWFRLGLMTMLVWAWAKTMGWDASSSRVVWPAMLIVSIGFGAAHLPQLFSYGAGHQSAIVATMLGNIVVSTLYGWLFWRRGLLAAITAHFVVDLILHVLPAFSQL